MLTAIIVDDELPARDELRYLLSLLPELEIVGETDNASHAITLAAKQKPDVIFLDINMREMNGLETAQLIRTVSPATMIVFATAYDEYALRAFEIGAVDYILKPFDEDRIYKTIARLKTYRPEELNAARSRLDLVLEHNKIHVHKLPVEADGKIRLLSYDDILYAYAHLGSVMVVTAQGEMLYGKTLSDLEDRVKNTHFLRVHKSYIVNMDQVREVVPWFKGTYWLKFNNCEATEIPVSKSHIKEIKGILGLY